MQIIKIPFGAGGLGKTTGTANAPDAIIKELDEIYLTENFKAGKCDIIDVDVVQDNVTDSHKAIEHAIDAATDGIIIGGDHSITYSCFKSFARKNPNAGILVFDAHPDLMHNAGVPTHEDYLRKLVEDGIIDPENIVLVGIRNIHPIEHEFIKARNIRFFTSKGIYDLGAESVCDAVMAKAREWDNVYLSIDIDVVDPAFAPGTNYREPAGITSREMLYFIHRLKFLNKIKMTDVVEVDPTIDVNNCTVRLAARIVKELH